MVERGNVRKNARKPRLTPDLPRSQVRQSISIGYFSINTGMSRMALLYPFYFSSFSGICLVTLNIF